MLKSKKLLIIVLMIVAGVAGFLVYKRFNQGKTASSLPPVSIPQITSEDYSVEIVFSEKDFKFPSVVPVLEKKSASFSEDEVKSAAQKLGFTLAPQKIKDATEGEMLIYSNDKAYLTASLTKGKMEYQLNSKPSVVNKGFSDTELIKLANDFITEKGLTNEPIKFSSFVYLKSQNPQGIKVVDKNEATIYQLNFSPTVSSFSLVTLNPTTSPISVRLLPDGSVYGTMITKYGTASQSADQYKLKNFQAVTGDINSKKATLITLDQGNLSPSDLAPGSLRKITFSQISLAYLDSGDPTLLQPVFILSGTAEVAGLSGDIPTAAYLPAISEN